MFFVFFFFIFGIYFVDLFLVMGLVVDCGVVGEFE